MNNIIFNINNFNQLPKNAKLMYEPLGGNVYALKVKYFKINPYKLPAWLSKAQYLANRRKIGNYYILKTAGFHREAIPLMKLDERIAQGYRLSYISNKIPKGVRITKLEYLSLAPKDKIKYKEIVIGNKIVYIKTDLSINIQKPVPKNPIRSPLVGKFTIPIGRWVEVPNG